MGEYIYRLKGTKSFVTAKINGVEEKVYDLVFWYKPRFSSFWGDPEPKWMRSVRMLDARLHNAFDKVGYPKYVSMSHIEDLGRGKLIRFPNEKVIEWKQGMICISDSSIAFDNLKRVHTDRQTRILELANKWEGFKEFTPQGCMWCEVDKALQFLEQLERRGYLDPKWKEVLD